ncbi:hypothetical protein JCM10450v2_002126 [Rhodotorula kratochvilovae]
MPYPPLSSTSPRCWRYTAEGGANIVVSFAGAPVTPFAGHVLRLRKRKVGAVKRAKDEAVPSEVEVDFGERIIAPLLGRDSVVEMEKAVLERGWLEELVQVMREDGCRPEERKREDEVDVNAPVGVLAEDLIVGEGVVSVEIKPKWGFLPSPTFLNPETAEIKTSFCRTCMHRYHKAGAADDEGFCPLDLYSPDEERVKRALEQLYGSWKASGGTFNNLRVFYGGKRVSPDELASPGHPLHTALSTLTSLPTSSAPAALLTAAVLPPLLRSPLLRTLARLQASLDALDIEGLASLLSSHPSTRADLFASPETAAAEVAKLGLQPSLAEWEACLARLAPALNYGGREGMARALGEGQPRDAVLAYLLSATLKDCSLIVRLPPPGAGGDGGGASVKAIDLDPKPIARMGKYARMDGEIVRSWRERLERMPEAERAKVRRCRE